MISSIAAVSAGAQGNWQPQASPSPQPPIYAPPPAPAVARSPKEQSARPKGNPVRRKVTATMSFEVTDPDAVPPSPAASLPPAPAPKRRKP